MFNDESSLDFEGIYEYSQNISEVNSFIGYEKDYNYLNLTHSSKDKEKENSQIFQIQKIERGFSGSTDSSDSNERTIILKKRGRKNGKDEAQHTKFKNDCKMAKIQRNYFTFLIRFLNLIMLLLQKDKEYFFCDIDGEYKSNINQKNRASLNQKTIKDILLEAPISGKLKRKDKNHNGTVYNRLEKEGETFLLNILDQNFLFFFENIYYVNIKKYDLSPFGLDLEVDLAKDSKIKTFKDLIEKDKSLNLHYENEMKKCVENYFLLSNQKRE